MMNSESQNSDRIQKRTQDLELEASVIQARNATRMQEHQNKMNAMNMEFHLKTEQISIAFRTLSNHFETQHTNTLLNSLSLVHNQVREAIEASDALILEIGNDNLEEWKQKLDQLSISVSDFRRELDDSRNHRQDIHDDLIKIVSSFQLEVIDAPGIAEVKHVFHRNDNSTDEILKHLEILKKFKAKTDEILGRPNPDSP